jgi:hypothetical protein
MRANHSIVVAWLPALDWEGTKALCMSLQLTPHLICSSGLETGAVAKARSRGHGLLSRSLSASRNLSLYVLCSFELTRSTDFLFQAMEGVRCTEAGWKVGKGGIQIDRLVFDSLSCVSRGSWQPLLRLLP